MYNPKEKAMDKIYTFISSNLKKEHDKSILDPSAIPQLKKMMQDRNSPRGDLYWLFGLGKSFGPDVAATVFKFSDYSVIADHRNISWLLAAEIRHEGNRRSQFFVDYLKDKLDDPNGIFFKLRSDEREARSLVDKFNQGRSLVDKFNQTARPLLQNDPKFIEGLLNEYGIREFEHASAELKNNPSFMLNKIIAHGTDRYYCINRDFSLLLSKYTSNELKDNPEFMLDLVEFVAKSTPVDCVLEHASERLKDSIEFMKSFMLTHEVAVPRSQFTNHYYNEDGDIRYEFPNDSDFVIHCFEANEYLPFFIHQIKPFDSCPEDKILASYKIKGLERMIEKGNLEKFNKYAQEFRCVQKNPNILSDGNPQAVLEMIKKEVTPLRLFFKEVRGKVESALGLESTDQQNKKKRQGLNF